MNTKNLYTDGLYLECNPTWHEEDSPWKASQIATILARNTIKPATVCEVGCGGGEILNSLARNYGDHVRFSGYEVSPQAFEICKKKQRGNLQFHLIKELGEIETHFDVVMAIDVFEHVEDYLGFLRQLRTKGTYKIFHIPLDLSVQSLLRGFPIMDLRKSVGHIHYFIKETALATLKDTGYEIVDYFYTGSRLELPNRGWKANLFWLPRKLFFAVNQDLAVRILGGWSLLVLAK
jgi:SAM-dependent methyltransferase